MPPKISHLVLDCCVGAWNFSPLQLEILEINMQETNVNFYHTLMYHIGLSNNFSTWLKFMNDPLIIKPLKELSISNGRLREFFINCFDLPVSLEILTLRNNLPCPLQNKDDDEDTDDLIATMDIYTLSKYYDRNYGLSHLVNLKEFEWSYNFASTGNRDMSLEIIKRLPVNVETLILKSNYAIKDEHIKSLANLTKLKFLDIGGTHCTGATFDYLPKSLKTVYYDIDGVIDKENIKYLPTSNKK